MSDCIFCDILAGRLDSSAVFQDELCYAFMDIQPVNTGHVLIIPTQHAASLAELDPKCGEHLFSTAQKVAQAIRKSDIRCEGINLFLSDGEAAGQEVFHVHLHVFPRFRGDGFGLLLGPRYADKPARIELNIVAQMIGQKLEE